MHQDSDYIHWLMVEQLTGDISEADEQYLSKLMGTNPAVREAYRRLEEQFSKEDLDTKFERLKVAEGWKPMPIAEKRPGRVVRLRWIGLAAAILTGLVFTISITRLKNGRTLTVERPAEPDKGKAISLQLAGGKTIYLSKITGHVTVDNGTLLNGDKDSLSFVAAGSDKALSAAVNTLTVPKGLDYKVLLSDGTLIWLNSSTVLKFPFSFPDGGREISIDGEAYLVVAEDARKPFIVHTRQGMVRVLGTAFNINNYDPGILKVSLVEGAVQLNTDKRKVNLKQGKEVIYTAVGSEIVIQDFDQDEILSWREGIHHFYNNTVQEISEVFPRWYGVKVVIEDNSIKNKRFTGILNKNEPIEKFLDALKATASINGYNFEKNELHLK